MTEAGGGGGLVLVDVGRVGRELTLVKIVAHAVEVQVLQPAPFLLDCVSDCVVVTDPQLKGAFKEQCAGMAARINTMRTVLKDKLGKAGSTKMFVELTMSPLLLARILMCKTVRYCM